MALKDLSGKTVYELDREDFEKLFCQQCRDCGICVKDPRTIIICRQLIDNGVWDLLFRKRQGN